MSLPADAAGQMHNLPTPAETEAFGARLADRLNAGDVLFLKGPLGAGKTTLARGLIRAWTQDPDIEAPSPTFTLVQTYDGPRGPLWHVDLYRLKGSEEAAELGLEEGFETALCLIEWPERLGGFAPRDRFEITLIPEGEARRAVVRGVGAAAARLDAAFPA